MVKDSINSDEILSPATYEYISCSVFHENIQIHMR